MSLIVLFGISGLYGIPYFINISYGLYKSFLTSSVTFNMDTLYLDWNTSFPAITVCELYNGERVWDISERYFGTNRSSQIDDYLAEVLFFRGTCASCSECENIDCPTDFHKLLEIFRTNCSDLFDECSWHSNDFDCCSEFLPINTEYGLCYSFNSNHAREERKPKFYASRITGPGNLQFFVSRDVQVHIHPPMEIPYFFSDGVFRETILWGTSQEIIFNVMEIYNDASVLTLSPEKRHCHFSTDIQSDFKLYRFYSYSTCVVECMRELSIYVCNCTNHFLVADENDGPVCNDFGLVCLTESYNMMLEQRKECKCHSSCEEPEYDIVYNAGDGAIDDDLVMSKIHIKMMDIPTQRYVRIVSKNNLDLIISVGGIAGLFFGASLIKVFEVIYYLLQYKIKFFLII
ncbi:pickpocket protein 19, partial [Episyrphus balteatus]|uniref:pickpocket protein 19 n=1 Tax=Episyrphus balteatus TaxID=286459 RepID=UPI0024861B6C